MQGVLQYRHPNGVKNETTEVRSQSPLASAIPDAAELRPANWRRWKDIVDDPQFKPGRRLEPPSPCPGEAHGVRVQG
jgi:hypothetical protein